MLQLSTAHTSIPVGWDVPWSARLTPLPPPSLPLYCFIFQTHSLAEAGISALLVLIMRNNQYNRFDGLIGVEMACLAMDGATPRLAQVRSP